MPADMYTAAGHTDRGNRSHRLGRRRARQSTWDPGTTIAPENARLPSHHLHRIRKAEHTMSLTNYGTSSDDDYTSSDNDHLFMASSPRRSSGSTDSPSRGRTIPRSRTLSRSTPRCVCRNLSAAASASSSAAAYSPVEPAIWGELRRLFREKDPRGRFDILSRSTPVRDERGSGFVLVEARVQAKDGAMVAKGEPCTDEVLALRSLRNALIETKGAKSLPFESGDEIIAGRIEAFEENCSACGLQRF